MGYQAKRKSVYTEDFELTEEDGTVVHTLHVSLDPDSVVKKLSEKHVALVRALDEMQKCEAEQNGVLEKIGNAVTDILEAVFGPEDAKTVVDFYTGRYIELCREVIPFITQTVVPRIREMAQDNKKNVIAGYGRKQRRMFGRK